MSRRDAVRLAASFTIAALASACQGLTPPNSPAPTAAPPVAKPTAGSELTLVVANSELIVGQNRFALALLENGRPLSSAGVKFEFFQVAGQNATKRSESEATYRGLEPGGKGLYVTRVAFDQPGPWGIQATVEGADRSQKVARTRFEVLARGSAPVPGDRAIPSHNPTARDVTNLTDICSAQPPCDMHDASVAEALSRASPTVLLFATPGYCTSQTCAPVLGEVQKLKVRRAGQASFVHVEIYKDPRNLVVAETVTEWHLQSEPWVFVVDRAGLIADRIESVTTEDELDASLASVL